MANEDVVDAVAQNLAQPLRARTEAGEVEQHQLDSQVEAAKFVIQTRAAAASPFASLRFAKQQSPGGVG